jgi:hypothetical protein
MPDLDLIKQEEQGVRDRRGRFARGRSGNPPGRPRGCRDHVNRAARLLLAGEGEIKSCATGLRVRSFSQGMPTRRDSIGKSRGRTVSGSG